MKSFVFGLIIFALLKCSFANAEQIVSDNGKWLPEHDSHPFSQIFSIQGGLFKPKSMVLSNSGYRYEYLGNSLKAYVIEPGWALKLFHLLGSVYIQESMGISSFAASLPATSERLSLWMLSFDTRIHHAWEWFPVKAVIPFIEGGYRYTLWNQTGPSDFESVQGSVGNFVGAFGVDFWINAMFASPEDSVNRYRDTPVFLTTKLSRILSSKNDVNLDSLTFLVGVSIGI